MTFHDTMTDMVNAGRREDGLTKMIKSQTEAAQSQHLRASSHPRRSLCVQFNPAARSRSSSAFSQK